MKKIILSCSIILVLAANLFAQLPTLQVQTALYNPSNTFPTIQNSNASVLSISASDTLRYFLNKHYYRNPSSGSPTPNTQYYTLSNPYPGTSFVIDYCGGTFLSATTVTVTGLEGIVTRRANSVSVNVPLKLYLCNVNGLNLPIFPPLDSVSAVSTSTNNGAWIGGNFNTPVTVNGKFAVLYKNVSTIAGDTLGLFINNACTPTSTCPAYQKFGESLGVFRINGNFQTTTNSFGTGTDYEFIVAPRVLFNYTSNIAVLTPTICTNSTGSFSSTSTPTNLIENRQFNFNKFAAVWGALSNTLLPTTDSIYNWSFSGSPTGLVTSKNATALFNVTGIQTASLAVKYNKSRGAGQLPSISDVSTATINASSSNAPSLTISGSSIICTGTSATLTAGGNSTFTWTNPPSNLPTIVVTPTSTTVYTVTGVNGACVGYQTFTVNVAINPTVSITSPSSLCFGKTLTITASGAVTYSWSTGSNSYSTIVTSSFVGAQIITVIGGVGSCPTSMATKTITVYSLPIVSLTAPVTTLCTKATGGNSVQLTGTPTGGLFSGPNFVGGVFTPSLIGNYVQTYSFTDTNSGCSNSATTAITVFTCQTGVGINELSVNSNIVVYPNPSSNGLFEIKNLESDNSIEIYNSLGEKILVLGTDKPSLQVDLSSYLKGVYILKITHSNGAVKIMKCIKQ